MASPLKTIPTIKDLYFKSYSASISIAISTSTAATTTTTSTFIFILNMNNMYYKEKRSNRVPRRTASEEEVSKFNRDYGYYIYLWYMYRG